MNYDNYSRDLLIDMLVDFEHQVGKRDQMIERLKQHNADCDREMLRGYSDYLTNKYCPQGGQWKGNSEENIDAFMRGWGEEETP